MEAAPSRHDPDEVKLTDRVTLVSRETELRDVVARLGRAPRIAVDIESNGLFKYRATICTIQIATDEEVVVVDTMAVAPTILAPMLGPNGPQKIVHDVAFDARILAEANIELANVFDTSLAARMLGRTSTGLAALLLGELGVTIDKKLQHHDWSERPLYPQHLTYLAADVVHLGALADKLQAEIDAKCCVGTIGIGEAIEEETRYRLAQAITAAKSVDPRPPYLRLKGVERVPKEELPILRRVADVREAKARSLDVPPFKVLAPEVLFAIARARPTTLSELVRIRGATSGHRARSMSSELIAAVATGVTESSIPDEERRLLERPRPPAAVVKERRAQESRLTAWRKAEAKKRGVDEQVILPGHCLQDLADLGRQATLETITAIAGLGAFRARQDAPALLAVLTAAPTSPPAHEGVS